MRTGMTRQGLFISVDDLIILLLEQKEKSDINNVIKYLKDIKESDTK